jgi:large subunit ribosomal protein L25
MQKIVIDSSYREGRGKGSARKLRAIGRIPAVIYRGGGSTPVELNKKEISRVIQSAGTRHLVTLRFPAKENDQDEQTKLAIMKQVQRDPLTEEILHVDFFEVAMDKASIFRVPLEIVGISVGVKAGGMLQQSLSELEVRCLPSAIPDNIRIDISSLEIGQSIHFKEVDLGEGVSRGTEENLVIVSVVPPVSEAKLEASLGTTPKEAGEVKEPEVIGQKEKEAKAKEKEAAGGKTKDAGAGKAKGKG